MSGLNSYVLLYDKFTNTKTYFHVTWKIISWFFFSLILEKKSLVQLLYFYMHVHLFVVNIILNKKKGNCLTNWMQKQSWILSVFFVAAPFTKVNALQTVALYHHIRTRVPEKI